MVHLLMSSLKAEFFKKILLRMSDGLYWLGTEIDQIDLVVFFVDNYFLLEHERIIIGWSIC